MNFTATDFNSSIGRMVFGDIYEPNKEDFDGNPLVIKSGPDKGKPTVRFNVGLAVPKRPGEQHWSQSELGAIIWAQGHRDHPSSATRDDFSWKVTDGDSVKLGKSFRGKPPRAPKDIEGYPGHWVFRFAGGQAPKVLKSDLSAYILDSGVVQNGDSIQIVGSVVGNEGASPGVYLNYKGIIWHGMHRDGRIASGGLDLDKLKKQLANQALPAFVVSAPATPSSPPAFGAYPPPLNNAPPPPPSVQQQVPQVPVTPSPSFIQPPPPPGLAVPPPPPVGPVMTAKAGGNSYASFIAHKWTDDMLRQNGYMV